MADDIEALVLTISADTTQIKRALEKLNVDLGNIKPPRTDPLKPLTQQFSQGSKAIANDTRNLQFQLNDIATSLASGGSPFQVLSQQAGQVSQILSAQGGGIVQSAKFIAGAFMGMLNPINLAIAAIGVATYAFSQYFSSASEDLPTLDEKLRAHDEWIKAIAKDYGLAEEALSRLVVESVELAKIRGEVQFKAETKDALAAMEELRKKIYDTVQEADWSGNTAFRQHPAFALLNEFTVAIEEKNIPALRRLQAEIIKLADQEPANKTLQALKELMVGPLADAALKSADAAKKTGEALGELGKISDGASIGVKSMVNQLLELYNTAGKIPSALNAIGNEAMKLQRIDLGAIKTINQQPLGGGLGTLPPLGSADGQIIDAYQAQAARDQITSSAAAAKAYLETVKTGAQNVASLNDDFALKLAALIKDFPDLGIASGYRTFAEQKAIYDSGVRPAAVPGTSRHEAGVAADLAYQGKQQLPPYYEAMVKRAEELGLRPLGANDPMHFQETGDSIAAANEKIENSVKKAETAYTDWKAAIEAKTDTQLYENQVNADSTSSAYQKIYLIEKQKAIEAGLAAAKEQNLTVDAKITAEINAHADALARAAANEQLRKDATAATTKTLEEQKQAQEQLAQAFDQMLSGGFSQFIIDMKNGVSAGEAFRNMLNGIIDQLIRMAVQAAVTQSGLGTFFAGLTGGVPAAGGIGGVAAALGGIVGSGIASRQRVSPLAFAGAKSYAAGGFVGGGPGATPIIAHKGELIIPVNTLRKAALGAGNRGQEINTTLGDVNIDMSQTGMVTANNEDAKAFGQSVQRLIQLEMVKESRPGGLLRRSADLR